MVEGSVRNLDRRAGALPPRPDEPVELDDFPAAVVCAQCGSADCGGDCLDADGASQVFAIVPWERPGVGWVRGLWTTSRLATLSHEQFFAALPGGDLAPALRFAVLAELVAVSLHALFLAAVASVLSPALPRALLASATLQLWALRILLIAIPLAAATMVALHLAHGYGLDLGARAQGSRPRHGLRFGCYSCGWDLVTLPLGWGMVALTAGPRAALRAVGLAITVPRRAAAAYLRGVHQLGDAALGRALWIGGLVPAVSLFTALVVATLLLGSLVLAP